MNASWVAGSRSRLTVDDSFSYKYCTLEPWPTISLSTAASSLFMGFLQGSGGWRALDIRSTLYEVLARALSGLLKGLVRPCPGIQSALYMALCESAQGQMGLRESKGFGEGIMSLSTAS